MMTDLPKRREQTFLATRLDRQGILLRERGQRLWRSDVLSSGNVKRRHLLQNHVFHG